MNNKFKLSLVGTLVILMVMSLGSMLVAADKITYEEYLIKSLNDEDVARRANAAQQLAQRNVTEAIQPLVQMLQNDKDFRGRIVAAVALMKLGDQSLVPTLKDAYKNETRKTVQTVLAGVIKELQKQSVTEG